MNPNNINYPLACNIAQIMDPFFGTLASEEKCYGDCRKKRKKKGANPCSYADHRSLKEYERINDGSVTEIRYGHKEVQVCKC